MSIGIDFILRANSSGFTRGMASVSNTVKGLKKELHEWGGGKLGHAIGILGVIEGFKMALEHAQKTRDELEKLGKPVDDATRSVASYADAWDSIKGKVGDFAVTTLSVFTRIGDAARHYFQNVTQDQENAARKMVVTTGKAADEAQARLKKSQEDNSPEKKKAAQEDLAKAQRENAYQGSDAEKKLIATINEQADIKDKMRRIGKETVEYTKLETELEKNKKAMHEAATGVEKEGLEKQKEAAKKAEEADKKKKQLISKFAPSVEDMAQQEMGGFFDANDPRLKARKVMQQEDKARTLFGQGDYKGGLEAAQGAESTRKALEDQMAGKKPGATGDKAPPTAAQIDELIKAVGGIIKAQP